MFIIPKPVREMPAAGMTVGRLIRICDLGTQVPMGDKFNKGPSRQYLFDIELPSHIARLGDRKGKPLIISQRFKASLHVKAGLRKFVEKYFGASFAEDKVQEWFQDNLWRMVGKPGHVNIMHTENGEYANLDAFSKIQVDPVSKKPLTAVPAAVWPLCLFILNLKYWNPTSAAVASFTAPEKEMFAKYGAMAMVYKNLPEHIQKLVSESPEFAAISSGRSGEDVQADAPSDNDGFVGQEIDGNPFES